MASAVIDDTPPLTPRAYLKFRVHIGSGGPLPPENLTVASDAYIKNRGAGVRFQNRDLVETRAAGLEGVGDCMVATGDTHT